MNLPFDQSAFSLEPSYIMHIDLNSCFATIEQQANRFLRGKPIGVVAYVSANGCILAPSIEAKKFGVKTGFRVKEAKKLCPNIIILPTDTSKYRYVHLKLRELLSYYTNDLVPKSIDEFVLNFKGSPFYGKGMMALGREIKHRIKEEIGDYMTVSIGISVNRFLAKTASNLQKPDGLNEINAGNYLEVYSRLTLTDLTGIAERTMARLNSSGIYSVLDLYNAPAKNLHFAFDSRVGYYWYQRLRGYEPDDYTIQRKSFGNSHTLKIAADKQAEITFLLAKLVEKTCSRMRRSGYKTQGVFVGFRYEDGTYWHINTKTKEVIWDSRDVYKQILKLYLKSPKKMIRLIHVGVFNLTQSEILQLDLFEDAQKKERVVEMVDKINNRWGNFVIGMAELVRAKPEISDKIGFGNVRELTDSLDSIQKW